MDWTAYAACYDLMAESNPAYQEIFPLIDRLVSPLQLSEGDQVLELGAGTGNFTGHLATSFPQCQITAIEFDSGMIGIAENKCRRASVSNVVFRVGDHHVLIDQDRVFSLVVAVHTIYCSPTPRSLLSKIFASLRPGGAAVVVDLGRPMNVADWRAYIFRGLVRRQGILKAVHTLWRGRIVAQSNHAIRDQQDAGRYWTHSTEEFVDAIRAEGFEIREHGRCYRDYSDWALAIKPMA